MNLPSVSVLIPNYNHARYLCQLLDSVLPLKEFLFEVIIRDDASTDNSWEILSKYALENSIIRLERNEKNLGGLENYKRLISEAKGEYMILQSADDFWIPDNMREMFEAMRIHGSTLAMYCGRNMFLMAESGHKFDFPSRFETGILSAGSVSRFHGGFPWGGVGVCMKTHIYRELYELLLPTGCFYDNFLELVVAQRNDIFFLNKNTAFFRMSNSNFSQEAKNFKKRNQAFQYLFKLLKTKYPDLYHAMYASHQFRVYEGIISFLATHPKMWDRYTIPIMFQIMPYNIWRFWRYSVISHLIPRKMKDWYRKYTDTPIGK